MQDIRSQTEALGLYVHFPWCRTHCPYCDFAIAVAPLAEIPHRRYAEAILAELEARAPRFGGRGLVSIYFGGGTPALWRADEIARVVQAGAAAFQARPEALEITVEANPNDCTPEVLEALRAAGVNRLSIGAQAFDDGALVALGRDHAATQAREALPAARRAGFEVVSLDLIYALPGRRDWRRTLEEAVALAPDHLSVYELTFEERTPFGRALRRGRMEKRPDDEAAAEHELAHAFLEEAGYQHYEVSSYARPGRRAVHNSLYWCGAEYLGLGNGACSFWRPAPGRAFRWANHRAVSRYLAAAPAPDATSAGVEATLEADPLIEPGSTVTLDAAALEADRLWLGLRTSDGVPVEAARGKEAVVARLVAAGLLASEAGRLRPTLRGFLLSDLVGAQLLE